MPTSEDGRSDAPEPCRTAEAPGHSRVEIEKEPPPPLERLGKRGRFTLAYYLIFLLLFSILQGLLFSGVDAGEISYSRFREAIAEDQVERVVITSEMIYGIPRPSGPARRPSAPPGGDGDVEVPAVRAPWHPYELWKALTGPARPAPAPLGRDGSRLPARFTVVPLPDPELLPLLSAHGVDYRGKIESHWFETLLLNWVVPLGLLMVLWAFLVSRMGKGPGMLSIGKNKARIYEVDEASRVRFSDLAGVDEAIEETRELVEFLHDPTRFETLGARMPKGVLLVGPPGTGKTLLARAIAGEAGVPFFSISGSDFVEMFVGVGAARVRDLFEEAKRRAPCIIFIDELDAVGKARADAAGLPGAGNDERESTLNQLLVEMDGFDSNVGVMLLAATNRPEILDKALLRPGRFDRRILLGRPSLAGRAAIFELHIAKLPVADDVDVVRLAAQTPGMVGADIANVCNEAALLASREKRERVLMADFVAAIERIVAGPQRKSLVVTPDERVRIAHHESGHTIIGHLTPGGDPVEKVSIIPRGQGALGYTLQMPTEDRYLMSRTELLDRIRVLLGGRAAEEIIFDEISTGASDDIEKASHIARQMVTMYGMSKAAPNLSLVEERGAGFLGNGVRLADAGPELHHALDDEVIELLRGCYQQALDALRAHEPKLRALGAALIEAEELSRSQIEEILGARPSQPPWATGPGGGG